MASAEDADCAHSPRLRVSGVQDQARATASRVTPPAGSQCPGRYHLRVPTREVDRAVQGANPATHQAADSSVDRTDHRGNQSDPAGLGSVLQTIPRPKALHSSGCLDRATVVVASRQALAL